MPICRFNDGPAVGRFRLLDGCLIRPEEREQDLCWFHAERARAAGRVALIADYTGWRLN